MKLNICMFLPLHHEPNMRVPPQIGICSYVTNFGHQVTWVIWGKERREDQPFLFNDVRVYTIPEVQYFPGFSLFSRILNKIPNTLRRMRIILKILRKGKYHLIFARDDVIDGLLDGLLAAYVAKRYKIPFVFQLSNPLNQDWEGFKVDPTWPIFLYYPVSRLKRFIATRLLHEADLILTTTRWFKEELVEQGIPESKIMPCPNGVDMNSFSNQDGTTIRKNYHLYDSEVIIYVGTMERARYLGVLIQAFTKVKKERKNVKLLMIGQGSDEENLKRLVNELGITDSVIFTGQVPQLEVLDFIAAADIGVCPVPPLSFYKVSSPIKLFEYMAMAKPVAANQEIPEQKEVVEESGGGILVPFTSEAFAEAIIELLDNPEKAAEMGQKARDWVVKNRSYEILARQVEQSYLSLVKKNG